MDVTIPGLPTGWDNNKRGNHFKQAKVQRDVKEKMREHVLEVGEPLEGDLWLFLDFYQPDRRVRDLENLIARCKPLIDVLVEKGWMHDDKQIVYIAAEKHPPVKGETARTEVGLYKAEKEEK